MRTQDFTENRWGTLVRTPQGILAFRPKDLPPPLTLDWQLATRFGQAMHALAHLGGTARNIPNPHLLIRPFVRREAVLSSRIEGTHATLFDLLLFEAQEETPARPPRVPDVIEVRNYVRALEYALRRLQDFPLSLRLIRELHERLMTGVRGDSKSPGQFRRQQVHIGASAAIEDATYVPPPPGPDMMECLHALEKFLHQPGDLPALVRIALVHYQFEAIHPFLDGNGRVGRLLISLMLCSEGLLDQPLLYLSAYFERTRRDYYRHLLAVSQQGAWEAWLDYFLQGVIEQSNDAVERSSRLLGLWERYRAELTAARTSTLLLRLLDVLFESPRITVMSAAELLGVTHRTASLHIAKLVDAGILREVTGRERSRVFLSEPIIEAIESPIRPEERHEAPSFGAPTTHPTRSG